MLTERLRRLTRVNIQATDGGGGGGGGGGGDGGGGGGGDGDGDGGGDDSNMNYGDCYGGNGASSSQSATCSRTTRASRAAADDTTNTWDALKAAWAVARDGVLSDYDNVLALSIAALRRHCVQPLPPLYLCNILHRSTSFCSPTESPVRARYPLAAFQLP